MIQMVVLVSFVAANGIAAALGGTLKFTLFW
jgi:hypothetical protein